jgi:hypothetical protein
VELSSEQLGKSTATKLHGERTEREPSVVLSRRNAMETSAETLERTANGLDQLPKSLSPRNAETRDPRERNPEFVALTSRHALEDIVKPIERLASLFAPFPLNTNTDVSLQPSRKENAKEPDVANGLEDATTTNARLLERNASGEDLLHVIAQDVPANGDNVLSCANNKDVVAKNVFATENFVSPRTLNATGLERKSVHQRLTLVANGRLLESLEEENGVATSVPNNVDSRDIWSLELPRENAPLLMLVWESQRKDVVVL